MPWMQRARLGALTLAGALVISGSAPAAPAAVVTTDAGGPIALAAAPSGPGAIIVWERGTSGQLRFSERTGAGAWTAPANLARDAGTPADGGGILETAVNPRGEAVVVWRRFLSRGERMLVATRSRTGRWSPLRLLATGGRLGVPKVSIAADGTAVVAWGQVRNLSTPTPVRASVQRPGGRFGPVVRAGTSAPASSPLDTLTLRALPRGQAVAAWVDGNRVDAVPYRAGAWGAAARLAGVGSGASLRLAPSGTAFASWFVRKRGGKANSVAVTGRVMGSVALMGGAWRTPRSLSGGPGVIGVEPDFFLGTVLEVDGANRAYAAWLRFPKLPTGRPRPQVGGKGAVLVATGDRRGWGTGVVRSTAGADAATVSLAASPGGGALLTWEEAVPGENNERALGRRSDPTGTRWESTRSILAPGSVPLLEAGGLSPHLGADRTSVVVMNAFAQTPVAVRTRAAAAWTRADLQEPGAFGDLDPVDVLVTADGAAYALLRRYDTAAYRQASRRFALVPLQGSGP